MNFVYNLVASEGGRYCTLGVAEILLYAYKAQFLWGLYRTATQRLPLPK